MSKAEKKIKQLRRQVDRADRMLMKALGARLKAVRKIGQIKIANDLPLLQKARWSEVIAKRLAIAERLGLHADFTHALYSLIHKEALRIQKNMAKAKKR